MKRKNTIIVSTTPKQRIALSAALDLLVDLRTGEAPKIDENTVESLCGMFDALDADDRTLGIEFTSKEHRVCSIALRYATLYLDGDRHHFHLPITDKVDQELNSLAPTVRDLTRLFRA